MATHAEVSLTATGDNEKNMSGEKASKVSSAGSTGSVENEHALTHMISVQDLQLDGLDPIYEAKVHALNQAMQEIGMGRYQWYLFCLTGFGWMADNVGRLQTPSSILYGQQADETEQMWQQCIAIILPEITREFNPKLPNLLGIGQQIGLIIGASMWSLGSDIIGRRLAFNMTLAIASIFGTVSAGAPNFIGLNSLLAVTGVGLGGNLPVDGSIFIEFCPASHQWLLTVMSLWWCIGQIFASLVAWPLIVNFSCPSTTLAGECPRSQNMGWRYSLIALGGATILMFVCRFFLFKLFESPKYYLAHGKDQKALDVVNALAKYNRGKQPDLTIEHLQQIEAATRARLGLQDASLTDNTRPSTRKMIAQNLNELKGTHIRGLFANRTMAISTTIIILIWGMIGMGYNLFNVFLPIYLETRGSATGGNNSLNTTYSNYVIVSVCGIPGSLFGGWIVQQKWIGRKGTLGMSTLLTGVFLFCYTQVTTQSGNLGFTCAISLTQNLMYGVLYAYTPEVFPAPHRGTGVGLASTFCRLCNTMVPIIASFINLRSSTPMWISGTLLLLAGLMAFVLPYEPNGKASV